MLHHHPAPMPRSRLLVVFDDDFVSRSLEPGATLADIADRVAHISGRHVGSPVAIEITLANVPVRLRKLEGASHGTH